MDIMQVVKKSAPLLASVIGSPVAGVALSLIGNAFGVDGKDQQAIADAINKDPESAIKLRTLEYENAQMLAKIASTDYYTEVSDRVDARKYSSEYKDFLRHMAYVITLGFFAALALMFLPIVVDNSEKELLSMLIGMLVSKWQTIIDFFYGSSSRLTHNKTN